MSFVAPFDAKEQVRQATDIVDLVGSYLQLRRQGSGYVAICPWHDDSRPSLQINPSRQSWKCWVCDDGGDAFSFVMKQEGVDFREALEMMAERAGIELKAQHQPKTQPGQPNDKKTLFAAAAWVEQQFHSCLLKSPDAEAARRYLDDRGINDDSIAKFHLGFSPNNWQWLVDRARTTPYSPAVLEAIGMIGKGERSSRWYDRFKGRVIFSIRDTQSRPIAFGGRVLPEIAAEDEKERGRAPAKYINSPETRLFSKSDQLYALDVVRGDVQKSKHVTVVEGYTDAVVANQCGLNDVVAVLGTALGARHIRLLRRYAETITLVLDGDEAGQRRTNEILELFVAAQVDLRILTLPEGLDPCDFVLESGAEAFRKLLDGAVDALEHKMNVETAGIDLATDTHRASQALENILGTLAKAPRLSAGTDESIRLREQQMLARMARQFRLPENDLRARLHELRRKTPGPRQAIAEPSTEKAWSISNLDPRESELLEILVLEPSRIATARKHVKVEDLNSEVARSLYAIFCEFDAAGEQADFTRVLTEIEDPQLKHILVELDERAQRKAEHAEDSVEARLQGLIQLFDHQVVARERREDLLALEERRFDEQEESDVLQKLIDQERQRQGISAPTDG